MGVFCCLGISIAVHMPTRLCDIGGTSSNENTTSAGSCRLSNSTVHWLRPGCSRPTAYRWRQRSNEVNEIETDNRPDSGVGVDVDVDRKGVDVDVDTEKDANP